MKSKESVGPVFQGASEVMAGESDQKGAHILGKFCREYAEHTQYLFSLLEVVFHLTFQRGGGRLGQ